MSAARSSMVRYDDSNHCRTGCGETSTGALVTRAPGSTSTRMAAASGQTPHRLRLRTKDVSRAVELRNVAADAIIFGKVPVPESPAIGRPLELHIRFEEPAQR